jgi:hypothetical protein
MIKNILAATIRRDALEDIRLNNAVGAAVGPMAAKENVGPSKKWGFEKQRLLDS